MSSIRYSSPALSAVRHTNILRHVQYYLPPRSGRAQLVIELANGGPLLDAICARGFISEKQV